MTYLARNAKLQQVPCILLLIDSHLHSSFIILAQGGTYVFVEESIHYIRWKKDEHAKQRKEKNGNNLRNLFKNLIPTDYNGNKAA